MIKRTILFTKIGLLCLFLAGCQLAKSVSDNTTQDTKNALLDKYWRLVELNGKSVEKSELDRQEAHIILKKEENRITGNAGCNSFFGAYTWTAQGVTFSGMGATRMACPNMEIEDQLLKGLNEIDSYSISQDHKILSFLQGTKIVAKFEVVHD